MEGTTMAQELVVKITLAIQEHILMILNARKSFYLAKLMAFKFPLLILVLIFREDFLVGDILILTW
jgi:hypothetical protein